MALLALLFKYSVQIAKERGFGKGRFFFLRSLLFINAATAWLVFVDKYFKKIGFSSTPWDIIALPVRLCLSNHLKPANRVKCLQNHFEILENYFDASSIYDLISGKNLKLVTLVGKSGIEYDFLISYSVRWRREGMLTIFMTDKSQEDLILTTLSFTLFKNKDGQNSMLIGGLQGALTEAGKSTIVKSTRDLHGLRPKHAVLECAYAIATNFSVVEILATSTKNHPVKRTNNRRNKHFHADYDLFWQEVGGVIDANKNFSLPEKLAKRKLEDVPSKKKKDWLMRHQFINEISEFRFYDAPKE